MFQQYVHPASIDPDLPFVLHEGTTPLFTYAAGNSGASFASTAVAAPTRTATCLIGQAPANSVLALNFGVFGQPAGLASAYVVFYDSDHGQLGCFPVNGNGISCFQDAILIPRDAVSVEVGFDGMSDVRGQIRVVDREIIPYQPLKG